MKKTIPGAMVTLFMLFALTARSVDMPADRIIAERAEIALDKAFTDDMRAQAYVNALINHLNQYKPDAVSIPTHIKTPRSALPFVFCLRPGLLVVSTGLLARVQNDSQAAFLIATEIVAASDDSVPKHWTAEHYQKSVQALLLSTTADALDGATLNLTSSYVSPYTQDKLAKQYDHAALAWLTNAGWKAEESIQSLKQLLQTLSEEKRFAYNRLANKKLLQSRLDWLTDMNKDDAATDTTRTTPALENTMSLRELAFQLAIDIATQDLITPSIESFSAVSNRLQAGYGSSMQLDCLHADFLRRKTLGTQIPQETLDAYAKCLSWPDAPASKTRELGFLYRTMGNNQAARNALESYLKKSPNAADAPLIKKNLESSYGTP